MSGSGNAAEASSANTTPELSEEIDRLLEQYLLLLDEYTTLRASLSKAQSSVHQSIARANFSAERGVRYGADSYDERMQATRVCRVTAPSEINPENPTRSDTNAAVYTVVSAGCLEDKSGNGEAKEETDVDEKQAAEFPDEKEEAKQAGAKPISKDPIRMFGILVPPALKMAQAEALKMTEEIIPKLVSVDAEMREVGIKIGRARKHRIKKQAKIEALGLEGATASVR